MSDPSSKNNTLTSLFLKVNYHFYFTQNHERKTNIGNSPISSELLSMLATHKQPWSNSSSSPTDVDHQSRALNSDITHTLYCNVIIIEIKLTCTFNDKSVTYILTILNSPLLFCKLDLSVIELIFHKQKTVGSVKYSVYCLFEKWFYIIKSMSIECLQIEEKYRRNKTFQHVCIEFAVKNSAPNMMTYFLKFL